jgi:hypothetical protein
MKAPPDVPGELVELMSELRRAEPMPPETLARVGLRLEKTLSIRRIDVPLRDQVEAAARVAPRGAAVSRLGRFLHHRAVMGVGMYLAGVVSAAVILYQPGPSHAVKSSAQQTPPPPRTVVSAVTDTWLTVVTPRSETPPLAPSAAPATAATVAALPAAPQHVATVSKLADERQLIEVARAALARSRPNEALAALEEHSRRFAKGQLEEECDSLRVEALVASGSYEEARAAAKRFDETYPESMLRGSIRHALQSIP